MLLEEDVCYDQCVLLIEAFASFCTPDTCYSRYLLTSYFCIPVPYDEKDIFLGVLVLEDLVGLHRTVQLQLLRHYWLEHRLGLL